MTNYVLHSSPELSEGFPRSRKVSGLKRASRRDYVVFTIFGASVSTKSVQCCVLVCLLVKGFKICNQFILIPAEINCKCIVWIWVTLCYLKISSKNFYLDFFHLNLSDGVKLRIKKLVVFRPFSLHRGSNLYRFKY